MVDVAQDASDEDARDPLTGLANRREFLQRLERALESARSSSNQHAVCYMDLDDFQPTVEGWGRAAGDELLRQLAASLRAAVRQSDTLARLDEDEFALLLRGCPREMAVKICSSLRQVVEDFEFSWEKEKRKVTVSMGLVPVTSQSGAGTEVIDSAHAACQVARELGPNRTYVYKEDDQAIIHHRGEAKWKRRIRDALAEDRLQLLCQRMRPLTEDDAAEHRELFLRMEGDKGELLAPQEFLPPARRHRLLTEIDQWVVQHAFALLEKPSAEQPKVRYTINISAQSMTDDYFQDFVIERLERYGLEPSTICFDISEETIVNNLAGVQRFIARLGGLGCAFAVDDFGANLGSFVYLKNLAVTYLKLDGELIRDMAADGLSLAIVRAVNEVAKSQGLRTIAEQVEKKESLDLLKELGVDYVQGFVVEEPVPLLDCLPALASS